MNGLYLTQATFGGARSLLAPARGDLLLMLCHGNLLMLDRI